MSGPIVRKYGFPNFEKIFGERPIQHGADTDEKPADVAPGPETKGQSTTASSGTDPGAKTPKSGG
jgi:hypothetical protein